MQDITTQINSVTDIMNMSAEDFILHKIRIRLDEINSLKEDYFKITGKHADHILNAVQRSQFVFPSKKEIENNIATFLSDVGTSTFKTNQIISRFHQIEMTKDVRNDLTRRYSGQLTAMKKDKKIFSKKVDGEKGDLFSTDEKLLKLM
ncbi:hypothetical protein SAMN05444410_106100 [Hydrobacter penzbergensis]|uniref:Uncharacterized protein n=1 Tax=Hydrobacter penzbergensis TaxID=1235997 RepID=A0A8X8IEL3_9BACT|nr:hypothetical protein [Hydrobacter penzbergensis]SDW84040.1 hypothetical protein SAMN05444410_106100 [Hydrobacter penzbergensis]